MEQRMTPDKAQSQKQSKKWMASAVLVMSLAVGAAIPMRSEAAFASPGMKCVLLPQLFDAYMRGHYLHKAMTDQIRSNTIEQLIKNMDPSKTLLLESDVAQLRAQTQQIFSSIQKGDCSLLEKAYVKISERSKENEDFVRSFLSRSYSLDENAEIRLDPDKRKFPVTIAEKQDILKGLIHFQISNYLLTKIKLEEAKSQLVHRYELITKRIKERQGENPVNGFAEAFASALDPHSSYLSPDNLEDFQIGMQLSLEGIGAQLSSDDGFTVIEDTIPGGGAEKTGMLKPKDKIIAVTQENQKPVPVIDMDLRDVVKLIRGKKGTKVILTILRQGEKTETFDLAIVRDKIDMKDSAAKISYETRTMGSRKVKVGVIDLPSFYGGGGKGGRSCSGDVKALLDEAKREKAEGIVLNLAKNGGGLLDEAVKISGLFIHRGGVVATRDSAMSKQVLEDQDESVTWKGPLVVLISRFSASASEILAGALQDYHRALIVGSDHTFGKGSVQAVVNLPPGLGAMKVTTGMFFIPGGRSTQHSGVRSDVVLPPAYAVEDVGEKTLDYSLPPQSMEPFVSANANSTRPELRWESVDSKVVPVLTTRSRERVAKSAKFAEIKRELEEASKNKGIVRLSELRKKSARDKEKEQKELARTSARKARDQKIKETEAPLVDESVSILVDWMELQPPRPEGQAIRAAQNRS
jgi:carboxyl-terminal processing protease